MANTMQTPVPSVPTDVIIALDYLCKCVARGARLAVRPGDRTPAVEWMRTLLSHPRARAAHFEYVAQVYRAAGTEPPRPPSPRDPLTAAELESLQALAHRPPDEFSDTDLATLLVDHRLHANLALLVHDLMPDWWLDELAAAGREYAKMVAIELGTAEMQVFVKGGYVDPTHADVTAGVRKLEPQRLGHGAPKEPEYDGPWEWVLNLPPEACQQIATIAYGDPHKPFELTLRRHHSGGADVEMRPVPRKSEVILLATFTGSGDARQFKIEVPLEARDPATPDGSIRPATRSAACAPLPHAAYPGASAGKEG
ncbi:MAG: hypothetical protein FJ304_26260 [Planctomycetes bacterium]|nr:hypothetical protein [Planctomycetota bacterium]